MNTSIISLHTHVPTYIQAQIQMCIHNASNQHTTRTYVHPNTRHTSLQILHPFGHGGFTPAKLESRFLSENDAHSEPTSVWYVSDKHAKIYIWTWMHTCHTWWPLTPPLLPHSCELQALSVAQARYARNISVGELMNVTDDEYRAVWQAAGDNPANHTFPLSLSCLLSLSLALSRSLALSLSRYPSVEPVYKRIFGHTHHVSQTWTNFSKSSTRTFVHRESLSCPHPFPSTTTNTSLWILALLAVFRKQILRITRLFSEKESCILKCIVSVGSQ